MPGEIKLPLSDSEISKLTKHGFGKFQEPMAHQEDAPDELSPSGIELKRQHEESKVELSASGIELQRQQKIAEEAAEREIAEINRKAEDNARIEEIHRMIQEELPQSEPDNGNGDGKDGMKEAA